MTRNKKHQTSIMVHDCKLLFQILFNSINITFTLWAGVHSKVGKALPSASKGLIDLMSFLLNKTHPIEITQQHRTKYQQHEIKDDEE